MSKIFKPRRGKASTMNGTKASTVLAAGEMFIEVPDTGVGTGICKMKMGDGVTAYSSLPYAMGGDVASSEVKGSITEDTSSTTTAALANVTTGKTISAIIGSLKRACQLNASSIASLNDDINNRYPIGSIYLSINNTNPSTYFGGTWELLSAGYVLKTITSGNGGVESSASATGGPSDNNTSSVTLTAAQSGCPAHSHGNTLTFTTPKFTHSITQPAFSVTSSGSCTTGGMSANESHTHSIYLDPTATGTSGGINANQGATLKYETTKEIKSTSVAHTHSVPNHTHTLSRTTNVAISDHAAASCTKGGSVSNNTASNATSGHSHTLSNHTHTTGMPASISIYAWKRTA